MIKKDKYGPEYVIEIYDPKIGMSGFLVIDNTVLGPGKGGIRMTPGVTKEEVYRLARTMTWKNALAGIPFGGAKAGIVWKGGDDILKKQFVQSFAKAIKPFLMKKYIAGPDVNTGEKEMQWFVEATGNLRRHGQAVQTLPSDWRKVRSASRAGQHRLRRGDSGGHRYQIEGFEYQPNNSSDRRVWQCRRIYLQTSGRYGRKIVAITDINGGVYDKNGLDEKILLHLKRQKKSPVEYPGGTKIETGQIFGLPADVLIPAAVTDSVNDKNKNEIKAKIIVEGSNIPMKETIEEEFFKKAVLVVPDFVANAGGVISSYAEYMGYSHEKMFKLVERKIKKCDNGGFKAKP